MAKQFKKIDKELMANKQSMADQKYFSDVMFIYCLQVFKPGISLSIALSAMLGYLIQHPHPDGLFYMTGIFTFLLCAGSGGVNNCQDRHRDAAFERTRNRPLPCGTLAFFPVLAQSTFLILLGIAGLGLSRQPLITMGLGFVGVILYNGVYTLLKPKTILAIIPGALCGMVPPAMGWTAAGGKMPMDAAILSVMVTLGVWQFPHYWLILMAHKNDYQYAATPNMLTLFSVNQLERILFVWILLFSIMTLMTPLFLSDMNNFAYIVLGLNGMGIALWFIGYFFQKKKKNNSMAFMVLNLAMGLFLTVLMMDRLFGA